MAERLLGRSTGVVGMTIRIGGYPYRIVGVTEAKGGSAFNNPDNNVYIPISTAQARLPRGGAPDRVQYILASMVDPDNADLAIRQIRQVLRMTHRIPRAARMISPCSTSRTSWRLRPPSPTC
jgi:putative ABC transport system permease protein